MVTELDSLHNLGVEGVDTGPFGDCMYCAPSAEGGESKHCLHQRASEGIRGHPLVCIMRVAKIDCTFADADPAVPPYLRGASFDAVTKCNLFRKCAPATKHIRPITNSYLDGDGAEAEIRDLEGKGKLNLGYADSNLQDEEIRACSAELHCARPEAPAASGPCDVHGVVGGVCHHGIPLRGMFVDMHGPEQFIYYLVLFKHLVMRCYASGVKVHDIYVDFACRLVKTWGRFLEKQGPVHFPSEAMLQAAREIRLLVNWMHGSSHKLSCQFLHNGRYAKDAGHRDGEGIERLWSHTKVSLGRDGLEGDRPLVTMPSFDHTMPFVPNCRHRAR